ncbi:3-oxoacyl-[acyl-carrier protein] reductase [Enhydrobacter aerosaccus]|uniref:3-oxoacyl-[acyl-carrier protein] reductase n=1 Tax=Enhydrobacter aerosaccus TaxID=225324 RepID=A0A1T4T3H9_9HYPH|nr:SDR family oxidoreductase [Enhydrobacter aerosaccus]SKA35055.1 3-oxoacyl-[acyl-carrier protein] reductase [Enhydrobacter aerosaccus]
MDFELQGRTAIVCASSRGLGRACAEALAAEGVNLVLNARTAEALDHAAAEIRDRHGVKVWTVVGNVADAACRDALLSACPAPDILVNNAGGPRPGKLTDYSTEDWEKALDGNLRAPAAMLAAVLDGMAERGFGRTVNITSSVVKHPIDVQGLSAAARSGLHGLVSTLVRRYVGCNVTINNILPGPFATDRLVSNFTHQAKLKGISPQEAIDARKAELPARRFGDPMEVGRLCAYLCSAHAAYISGQSILIDGGNHPQII